MEQEKAKALYKAILEIPDNQYRAMFLLLLRGRRSGEVLSLEWQNINLEKQIYIITDQNSKIRKNLVFLLDNELVEALNCLIVKSKGFVFISQKTGTRFKSFPRSLSEINSQQSFQDSPLFSSTNTLFKPLVAIILVQ